MAGRHVDCPAGDDDILMHRPQIAMVCGEGDDAWPLVDEVERRGNLEVAASAADLGRVLGRADVVLVTDFRTELLREAWPDDGSIRWVHATSAGVDKLMFPELADSGAVVTNARGVFDPYIAEYVLGCVIAFAKGFLESLQHQRQQRWHYHETEPVRGRRMLVYGAGSIGRATARLARAVGMRVDGIARNPRADPDFDSVRPDADLDALLSGADFVVITAPLTAATRHRFGPSVFARMRSSACLINVGRGAVVDTDALVDALVHGGIAGAVLDVLEDEPLPVGHRLWDLPNVMITAHLAGDIRGWRTVVMQQFLDNLDRWIAGIALENQVDKTLGFVTTNISG